MEHCCDVGKLGNFTTEFWQSPGSIGATVSSIIYRLRKILLGLSNQGGWDGRGMKLALKTWGSPKRLSEDDTKMSVHSTEWRLWTGFVGRGKSQVVVSLWTRHWNFGLCKSTVDQLRECQMLTTDCALSDIVCGIIICVGSRRGHLARTLAFQFTILCILLSRKYLLCFVMH